MSNHRGSYMLNEVLNTLADYDVFNTLGKKKTQSLTHDIMVIGHEYDCNSGEILLDIEEMLGMCRYCVKPAEKLYNGICKECKEEDEY